MFQSFLFQMFSYFNIFVVSGYIYWLVILFNHAINLLVLKLKPRQKRSLLSQGGSKFGTEFDFHLQPLHFELIEWILNNSVLQRNWIFLILARSMVKGKWKFRTMLCLHHHNIQAYNRKILAMSVHGWIFMTCSPPTFT